MAKLIHIFPLSVFQSGITIEPDARMRMVDAVLEMGRDRLAQKGPGTMWTGDLNGHELLHNDARFVGLFAKFAQPLHEYLDFLRVDPAKVRLHFTRSWATISRGGDSTQAHSHMQSHLSLVYYLSKTSDSSGISFINKDPPNQFAPHLFGPHMVQHGVVRETQLFNSQKIYIEPQQDDVLIFPSRALHEVPPNRGSGVRISLACDIVVTVRNSAGLEYMMPDPQHWKAVD